MPSIPNVQLGRNVASFAIIPLTVGTDGTLTDGTSTSVLGQARRWSMPTSKTTEETGLISALRRNNVIVDTGADFELEGVLFALDTLSGGTTTNPAQFHAINSDYVKITFGIGGRTWTYYGLITEYAPEVVKGVCTFRLRCTPIDPAVANPAYS